MNTRDIIVVTTENIKGKEVVEVLGLVRGNTIRARNIGRDIGALFKNIVGGEIKDYTKMMAESREQALDRMRDEAAALGANAVIMTRFSTSSMMQSAAELLVYGTAVVLK